MAAGSLHQFEEKGEPLFRAAPPFIEAMKLVIELFDEV